MYPTFENSNHSFNPQPSGLKQRIFGILALAILVLPILIGTANQSMVLGVSENDGEVAPSDQNTNPSMISSGVSEEIEQGVATQSVAIINEPKTLTGQIAFADEQKAPSFNSKLPLGKEVKIVTKQSKLDLVVNQNTNDDQKELAVVSKALFIELGGDPKTEKTILAEIEVE